MKYSNRVLTDDNFDEEFEKILGVYPQCFTGDWEVYDKPPSGFSKQKSDLGGFEEWIKCGTFNDHSSPNLVINKGEIAFEFENKFISFYFSESL